MKDVSAARVEAIAKRVKWYIYFMELPAPDYGWGVSIEGEIASLIATEELTDDECYRFVICGEEVNPLLDEDVALKRMNEIIQGARIRRGCPVDRMNDAISYMTVKLT